MCFRGTKIGFLQRSRTFANGHNLQGAVSGFGHRSCDVKCTAGTFRSISGDQKILNLGRHCVSLPLNHSLNGCFAGDRAGRLAVHATLQTGLIIRLKRVICFDLHQQICRRGSAIWPLIIEALRRPIMNELRLRDDILDELAYEPVVDSAHIGVAVDQGVVTITGHVSSYVQKQAALSAVRRVKGVRGIADEIEVRHPTGTMTSDDEIAKRAINVLSWDSVVPANAIQVTVRDGLVTLSGKVSWHYQKGSAERDIRRLSGVRSVVNNIEVEPHAKPGNVKKKIEAALKRRSEIDARSIHVTVRDDDEVLLEGKVRNWGEKFAVENAAWSAPGVKNVRDKLTIGS